MRPQFSQHATHKAFHKILRFRWFLGWLILSNSYLPVQAHLHKWKCSDIGTQKSVLHTRCSQNTACHIQIADCSWKHGMHIADCSWIADCALQRWIFSTPHHSQTSLQYQYQFNRDGKPTFTLWFHSDHAAVMNECTKSLPRTKSLALWLLIEHINIYDNMQMLAQCPFSCTHLPTKKQPKRQENQREQEEENMEKCSNPLFFGLNLWYSIWTIILPASKFQIDITN